jgi:hypothetical protein
MLKHINKPKKIDKIPEITEYCEKNKVKSINIKQEKLEMLDINISNLNKANLTSAVCFGKT